MSIENETSSALLPLGPPVQAGHPARVAKLRRTDILFLIGILAICGLAAFTGAAPIRIFAHDTFFLLDNGYRTLQGQIPHRDFSSSWGPVIYLVEAFGLLLSGGLPDAIGYANSIAGALVAIWSYALVRARSTPGIAVACGLVAALIMVSPHALGYSALWYTHAMTYNRYGYALLGIVILETALDAPVSKTLPNVELSAFATGCALGLLVFLKVSYAFAAVPFLLLSALYGYDRKRRCVAALAGFSVVCVLCLAYLRFDINDMLADLNIAARQRSHSLAAAPRRTFSHFGTALQEFSILILTLGFLERTPGHRLRISLHTVHTVALALAAIIVGQAIMATNNQPGDPVLNVYVALVFVSYLLYAKSGTAIVPRYITLACCILLVSSLIAPQVIASLGAAVDKVRIVPTADITLNSDRGHGLLFPPSPDETETSGPVYVRAVNQGLDLLNRYSQPGDGVFALDFFNPFNYLLHRRSPTGGLTTASFSAQARPSEARIFGNARILMVRKYSSAYDEGGLSTFRQLFHSFIEANFFKVQETDSWILYQRLP